MEKMERKYYRISDVATLFGVSTRTIHRWIAGGQLKACKLPGGILAISIDEVNRIEGSND